jgi:hypothetical protein
MLRKETADLNQKFTRAQNQLGSLLETLTLDVALVAADADAGEPPSTIVRR